MTHGSTPVEHGNSPERVWGIQTGLGIGSLPERYAFLAGLVYLIGGVIGFFFTGFSNFTEDSGVSLFGLFHLTPFHNLVHIGVGVVWLLAAYALTRPATEGVNFAIGGVYVLAAILGYLGYLEFLGIHAHLDADNFLHLVTGLVTLVFSGLIPLGGRTQSVQA